MLRQAGAGWASSSRKKPEVSLPLLWKAAGMVCLCGIRVELWTYTVLDTNNKEWFDKVVNDSNTGEIQESREEFRIELFYTFVASGSSQVPGIP